jgi:hypothetical protein
LSGNRGMLCRFADSGTGSCLTFNIPTDSNLAKDCRNNTHMGIGNLDISRCIASYRNHLHCAYFSSREWYELDLRHMSILHVPSASSGYDLHSGVVDCLLANFS